GGLGRFGGSAKKAVSRKSISVIEGLRRKQSSDGSSFGVAIFCFFALLKNGALRISGPSVVVGFRDSIGRGATLLVTENDSLPDPCEELAGLGRRLLVCRAAQLV